MVLHLKSVKKERRRTKLSAAASIPLSHRILKEYGALKRITRRLEEKL